MLAARGVRPADAARLWAAARGCGVVPECRVPSGPAAREIATREPAARSGRSRSPPVPSGPYGTRHAGFPWCWCRAAVRLSAVARAGGLVYCLSVGCLRARPPCACRPRLEFVVWCGACVSGAFGPGRPRDRHTRAWRLGVVDLEARPCPPGPTAPATLAAHGAGARSSHAAPKPRCSALADATPSKPRAREDDSPPGPGASRRANGR